MANNIKQQVEQSSSNETIKQKTIRVLEQAQEIFNIVEKKGEDIDSIRKEYEEVRLATIEALKDDMMVTGNELSKIKLELSHLNNMSQNKSDRSIFDRLAFIPQSIGISSELLEDLGIDTSNLNITQNELITQILGGPDKNYGNGYIKGYNNKIGNYIIKISDFETYLKNPNTQIDGKEKDNFSNPNIVNSKALASFMEYLFDKNNGDIKAFFIEFKSIVGNEKLYSLGKIWKNSNDTIAQNILEERGYENLIKLVKGNNNKIFDLNDSELGATKELLPQFKINELVDFVKKSNKSEDEKNRILGKIGELVESKITMEKHIQSTSEKLNDFIQNPDEQNRIDFLNNILPALNEDEVKLFLLSDINNLNAFSEAYANLGVCLLQPGEIIEFALNQQKNYIEKISSKLKGYKTPEGKDAEKEIKGIIKGRFCGIDLNKFLESLENSKGKKLDSETKAKILEGNIDLNMLRNDSLLNIYGINDISNINSEIDLLSFLQENGKSLNEEQLQELWGVIESKKRINKITSVYLNEDGKIDYNALVEDLSNSKSKKDFLETLEKKLEEKNSVLQDTAEIKKVQPNFIDNKYSYSPKTGTIKIPGEEKQIQLSEHDKNIVKNNPETLSNIVDFYKILKQVGLSKLWNIKEKIFKGISNVTGIGFRIDGDYLNKNEVKIFLNSVLKSVGEKTINSNLDLENFIAKLEILNGNQLSGEEKDVNRWGDTRIEANFINNFYPRDHNGLVGFNLSEFEKTLKI